MELLSSLDEYNHLFNTVKQQIQNPITNMYFYGEDLKTDVLNRKVYYDLSHDTFQVYIDYEKYLRYFFLMDRDSKLVCSHTSKPLYGNYIHRRSEGCHICVDDNLSSNGFKHFCTMLGYDYDPVEVLKKTQPVTSVMLPMITKKGFSLIKPEYSDIDAIIRLWTDSDGIPYWRIDRTMEKIITDLSDDCIYCIVNKNHEICAGVYSYSIGQYEYGWIGVAEKYRRTGIMSTILTNEKIKTMIRKGHTGRGWIATDNYESMHYHTNIGYILNGRYKEEFIRE